MAAQNPSPLKTQEVVNKPAVPAVEEVKTLLSWKALDRPFKKRSKDYYTTIAAIVFLVVVILLFFHQWFLIMAILSLAFLAYVLGTVSPREVEHKITTQGIITGGHSYLWRELYDFWFDKSQGQPVLNVTTFRLPGRLFMMLGDQTEEKVKEVLAKYIPFREVVEKTWTDKASEWLSQKIPLEKQQTSSPS